MSGPQQQYRHDVDWQRLFAEGPHVPIGDLLSHVTGDESFRGQQGTVFVAPYSASSQVFVVLIPIHRARIEWVKDMVLALFHSARAGWPLLGRLLSRSAG